MILVAGGTGRLGSALVTRLLGRGEGVRVLTRDAARAQETLPAEVEIVAGDVRDPASVAASLRSVSCVVSAVTGFGPKGAGTVAVDQRGNLDLLSAAQRAGVECFVLVSIRGAAADHPVELNRCKFAAEQGLRASSLDWRIVRPTVFAELWLQIIGGPVARGGKATVFGRGDNPINFVAVDDVAAATERAVLDSDSQRVTFEVGGPDDVTMAGVVELVAAACGRRAEMRRLPVPVLRLARAVLRPVRPDVAGRMEAAREMAAGDMAFRDAAHDGIVRTVGETRVADLVAKLFAGPEHQAAHAVAAGGRRS